VKRKTLPGQEFPQFILKSQRYQSEFIGLLKKILKKASENSNISNLYKETLDKLKNIIPDDPQNPENQIILPITTQREFREAQVEEFRNKRHKLKALIGCINTLEAKILSPLSLKIFLSPIERKKRRDDKKRFWKLKIQKLALLWDLEYRPTLK